MHFKTTIQSTGLIFLNGAKVCEINISRCFPQVILTRTQMKFFASPKEAAGVVVEDYVFGIKHFQGALKLLVRHNFREDM